MTPEWKLFSVQNLCFTHDSRVVTKFGENRQLQRCRSHIVLFTKKTQASGTLFSPPISPPLSRSRPKFRERCQPLTCARVPTLVQIGCGLPDLFQKESKRVKTINRL